MVLGRGAFAALGAGGGGWSPGLDEGKDMLFDGERCSVCVSGSPGLVHLVGYCIIEGKKCDKAPVV